MVWSCTARRVLEDLVIIVIEKQVILTVGGCHPLVPLLLQHRVEVTQVRLEIPVFLVAACATSLDSESRERTITFWCRPTDESENTIIGDIFNFLVGIFQGLGKGLDLPAGILARTQ